MTIDPTLATDISVPVRDEVIQVVRQVPGVEIVHPPSHGLLQELTGSPLPGHESLRIRTRGVSTSAEIEIGISADSNAVEVAAAVQERIFEALAPLVATPKSLRIIVTVL